MKQIIFFFSHKNYLGVILLMLNMAPSFAQSHLPLSLSTEYTVEVKEDGSPEEYSEVSLTSKDAHLIVEGTLIIYGDLDMTKGNDARLTFRDSSVVVVYGNVEAGNKISISANSHFIVYGNFSRGSGSGHGQLDFTNGNVYIFGDVDDTWEIDDCETGNDGDSHDNGSCEYRTEDDFYEDDLDPELQDALNCFKISQIEDEMVCKNQSVTFKAEATGESLDLVTYQWQEKMPGGVWESLEEETESVLVIEDIQSSLNGAQFRVVVKSDGACKMGISNAATLTVTESLDIGEITGQEDVCERGSYTYSVSEIHPTLDYSWEVPSGWTFTQLSNSEISVIPNINSGEIKFSFTDNCGDTIEKKLWVEVRTLGRWNGTVNSLWEETGNWECGIIPDSSINVSIPESAEFDPVINTGITATIKDIYVEAGARLEILGTLRISGDVLAAENIESYSGSLSFTGSSAQTIPLNTFEGGRVKNLEVKNSKGVIIEEKLEITGLVKLVEGDLSTNGNLTIISNEIQTGLISGVGSGNLIGELTMQRYLDPAFGYKYISSPFSNSSIGDLVASIPLKDPDTDFPHFYRYNEGRENAGEDLTGWEAYTDPTNSLNVLEGYAINVDVNTAPVTLSLSGEVNNGPLRKELNTTHGTYTKGFHLIGNPYPSPIDWDSNDGWTQKQNIDNGIYFFNASSDNEYTGTYTSYVNGISSADGNSSSIIPSMQGFFVHVADGASLGVLEINNKARVENFSQQFLKTPEKKKALIRINASFENSEYQDPTVIYFNPSATASFDSELDAFKMMNTSEKVPNLYSLTPENKELSINAFSNFTDKASLRIPLGIKTERSGNITIGLNNKAGFSTGYYLYLIDLENNTSVNLKDAEYTFLLRKGTHNSRFELVLSKEPITEKAVLLNEPLSVSTTNGVVKIKLNLAEGQEGLLNISTIGGQILRSVRESGKAEIEIPGIKSSGVYIVSLQAGKSRFSKKIILQK